MPEVSALLEQLLHETGASRVTLRVDVPGPTAYPVVEEVLAAGVGSLRGETSVHLPTQPVVLEVREGRQVVQDDCATAYDDPSYQAMLRAYGGLASQIVTPVVVDGSVKAILSLHQLERPRVWSEHEIAQATRAAELVGALL
jgi:GAF domain-containing protein